MPAARHDAHWRTWIVAALIVAAGIVAYANSFSGMFLLDDTVRIVLNTRIRELWPLSAVIAGNARPLVELSLALNYALDGLAVAGYHAVNLAVHLLAGLTLFGIVRRMLNSDALRPRYGGAAPWLAAVIAIVWTVHPLQTESVTYVIQRAEAMMGLFLLCTLYAAIRGAASPHPRRWYAAAIIACACGMATKEVMVVAPFIVFLYDRLFLSPSLAALLRRRWALYAGLAATWLVLAALIATSRSEEQIVLTSSLTPVRYALTQFGVIAHYLRLVFWPHPLILDYAWQPVESLAAAWPAASLVLGLLGATAYALYRRWWQGFWGAWFFLILAPTSSIYPIADIAFEHRLYLPLAAAVVLAVIGVYAGTDFALRTLTVKARIGLQTGLALAVIAALTVATVRRNEDYRDEYAMWRDVVAARPDNPRARYNLGNALDRRSRPREAMAQYEAALAQKPDYVDAHVNLGALLLAAQRRDEAIAHFEAAIVARPDSAEAHNNLGAALFEAGRRAEALPHLAATVRLRPNSFDAHHNLAQALAFQGRVDEALPEFAAALSIDPANAAAHYEFANALVQRGKQDDALAHYNSALRLRPDYPAAREGRASVLARRPGAAQP